MFAPRIFQAFASQHGERSCDSRTGVCWHDDVIDVAAASRDERVRKLFPVLFGPFRYLGLIAQVVAENDLDRSFGSHHRYLRARPGEIDIPPQVRDDLPVSLRQSAKNLLSAANTY